MLASSFPLIASHEAAGAYFLIATRLMHPNISNSMAPHVTPQSSGTSKPSFAYPAKVLESWFLQLSNMIFRHSHCYHFFPFFFFLASVFFSTIGGELRMQEYLKWLYVAVAAVKNIYKLVLLPALFTQFKMKINMTTQKVAWIVGETRQE